MSVNIDYDCDLCCGGLSPLKPAITVYEDCGGVRLEKGLKQDGDRHFCVGCAKILVEKIPSILRQQESQS